MHAMQAKYPTRLLIVFIIQWQYDCLSTNSNIKPNFKDRIKWVRSYFFFFLLFDNHLHFREILMLWLNFKKLSDSFNYFWIVDAFERFYLARDICIDFNCCWLFLLVDRVPLVNKFDKIWDSCPLLIFILFIQKWYRLHTISFIISLSL